MLSALAWLVGVVVAFRLLTQVSLLRTVLRRGPALVRLRRLRRLRIRAGDLAARRLLLEQLHSRLSPARS